VITEPKVLKPGNERPNKVWFQKIRAGRWRAIMGRVEKGGYGCLSLQNTGAHQRNDDGQITRISMHNE